MIRQLLSGYRSLAPALSTSIERDNAALWCLAVKKADALIRPGRPLTRLHCALWLAVHLQVLGLRPLAAVRACLVQSQRTLVKRQGQRRWEVKVLIDKHNPTAAMQAPQRRWLPVTPTSQRVMAMLPYPATRLDLARLVDARKALLSSLGIRQTYSARRASAAQADEDLLDPGKILAHRPGSKSTPGYVGSATPAAALVGLRPLAA